MHYEDVLERVRQRAQLPTLDHADRVVRAVLVVLGELVHPPELITTLPPALQGLLSAPERPTGQGFGRGEFDRRVAGLVGTGYPAEHAHEHARVVVRVLTEDLRAEQRAALKRRLPAEYADLIA